MRDLIKVAIEHFDNIITGVAVIASLILQYRFNDKKGLELATTVVLSFIVTGFTFKKLLDVQGVSHDSPFRDLALVSAGLIGMFLVNLFIEFGPEAIVKKVFPSISKEIDKAKAAKGDKE